MLAFVTWKPLPATPDAAAPTTIEGRYVEPDLRAWVFSASQMKAAADARGRAAQVLAIHVTHDLAYRDAADLVTAARVLGVALRLDPANKAAVLANAALRRGRRPTTERPADWGRDSFVKEMLTLANAVRSANTAGDRIAAAHLYEIILAAAPDNEDALYEREVLKQAEVNVDWSWADPNRPGAQLAAGPDDALAATRPGEAVASSANGAPPQQRPPRRRPRPGR